MALVIVLIACILFFAIANFFGRAKHIGYWWTFLLLFFTPLIPGLIALILSPSANKQPNQPNKIVKVFGIVLLILALLALPSFFKNLDNFASPYPSDRWAFRFSLMPLMWFTSLGIYLYKLGQGQVVNKQPKFYFKFQLEPKLRSSIVKALNQLKPNPYSSPSNNAFYFLVEDGKQSEPYTFDQLRDKRIKEDDLIWRNGLDNWVKAGEVKELNTIIFKLPPPIPNAIAPIQEEPSTTEPIKVPVTIVSNENQDYTPPKPPDDQWSNSPFILLKTIALVTLPIILIGLFVAIYRGNSYSPTYEEAVTDSVVFEEPPITDFGAEMDKSKYKYDVGANNEVCRAFYGGYPPSLESDGNVDEVGNLHVTLGQNINCNVYSVCASALDKPSLTDSYTFSLYPHEEYIIEAKGNELLLVFWGEYFNPTSSYPSLNPGKLFVTHDGQTIEINECESLPVVPGYYFKNASLQPGKSKIMFLWRIPKYDSMHIEWQPSLCENENGSPKIHIW